MLKEYKTVEKMAEFLGMDKCVVRAFVRSMPDLNREVQRIQQAPYRKAKPTIESLAQYKSRLRSDVCVYCGTYGERMTIDHIVPVSKGGPNVIENIAAACSSCNSDKGSTDLLGFLLSTRE